MAVTIIQTACGYRKVNDQWTASFLQFVAAMEEARGSEMSFNEKEAFFNYAVVTSPAFTLEANATGVTLTSSLLVGLIVPVIVMDGNAYINGTDFRKGAEDDTEAEQLAASTITLIAEDLAFTEGQAVAIIKGNY